MPVVVAYIGYALAAIGGTTIIGYIGAFLVTYAWAIGTVLSMVAINAVSRALMKKSGGASGAASMMGRTLTIREPLASRSIIYGEVRAGGVLVYAGSSGANKEYLHLVVAHAGHECKALSTLWLNDEIVPLTAGAATGKYTGLVRCKDHLGSTSQTVDTDLQTDVGATEWPNTSRGRGICYSYVRLKYDPTLFPSGWPNISRLVKGALVYDPRTTVTDWSMNPALCIRDYIMNTDVGLGAMQAEVDDAATITAANLCEEAVTLRGGGTEYRYTMNGIIDTSAAPGGILEDMRASMAGICPYINGQFKMKAGAHTSPVNPVVTLDDARGAIVVAVGDSMRDSFNAVRGVFISPDNTWQPADFPVMVNRTPAGSLIVGSTYTINFVGTTTWTAVGAASNTLGVTFVATGAGSGTGTADKYINEDNGVRSWKDIKLPFTISSSMAQRIAKIDLERSRRDKTVQFPGKLTLMNFICGDVVALTIDRYSWNSKLFEVLECSDEVDMSGGIPTLGNSFVFRETDAAIWDWSPSVDEQTAVAAADPTLYDPSTVPAPADPVLSSANIVQSDGTVVPRIEIDLTPPADVTVTKGGYIHVEYKKNADATWLIWNTLRGDATIEFLTDVLVDTVYDVRVRFENVRGSFGVYSNTISHSTTTTSVALPSLDPPGTLFTTTVTVTASCATAGSTIRYTVDGTPVTDVSPAFPGGGLTLSSSTTLRVKAFNGGNTSNEITQHYTLNSVVAQVATPSISFSPASFTSYAATSTCTITCATAGSAIHKQINGGGYSVYTGAFTVNNLDFVESYATKAGLTDSSVASNSYENNT